jgi:hypothetical protein
MRSDNVEGEKQFELTVNPHFKQSVLSDTLSKRNLLKKRFETLCGQKPDLRT